MGVSMGAVYVHVVRSCAASACMQCKRFMQCMHCMRAGGQWCLTQPGFDGAPSGPPCWLVCNAVARTGRELCCVGGGLPGSRPRPPAHSSLALRPHQGVHLCPLYAGWWLHRWWSAQCHGEWGLWSPPALGFTLPSTKRVRQPARRQRRQRGRQRRVQRWSVPQ